MDYLVPMTRPTVRDRALYGSRAEEPLTLVDEHGEDAGSGLLADVHRPPGMRHRAFSVYLFDDDDRMLVHQRHALKPLWGSFWSNSCCSHNYHTERVPAAAERRVRQELGVEVPLSELFSYEYRAEFLHVGVEHEFVHVFVGRADPREVEPAENEIDELRWLAPDEVDALIAEEERVTPWFVKAWPRVKGEFKAALEG